MGKGLLLKSGSSGVDPDGLTAKPEDVLKGKLFAGTGSDEPLTGTLALTGTAGDSQVLAGSTYYNSDAKTKRTGTMTNRGAVSQTLNCGGSYTIPAGYHNGGGKVTANSLASQTSGTATAGYIRSGYTAWVNGNKLTGTMTVSSILSFSVAANSSSQVTATWKNPAKGPYSGVIIQYATGGSPTSVTNGTRGYKGSGTNSAANASSTAAISGLVPGTTYYFRAWAYCTTSAAELYSSAYLSTTCATQVAKGSQTFTASGTFTVPSGVKNVQVFCVGGGGAGGTGGSGGASKGAGGGGGYTKTGTFTVTPGSKIAVTVGAGGTEGGAGGTSSFGTYLSASGGLCAGDITTGSKGGSGGGGGALNGSYSYGGCGGSNGSDSTGAYNGRNESYVGAKGQGTTTRAFGESSGTLYAGGGGGAGNVVGTAGGRNVGLGGAGGGGNGGRHTPDQLSTPIAVDGTPNTGGGGGGAAYPSGDYEGKSPYHAKGGSGIVLVRWGY